MLMLLTDRSTSVLGHALILSKAKLSVTWWCGRLRTPFTWLRCELSVCLSSSALLSVFGLTPYVTAFPKEEC